VYINPTLLSLLAFALLFLPTIQEWVTSGGSAWYRPFLIWAALVLAAWWNQRQSYRDDL
jgi:hypothetical protein